ncbi:MAG TPA: hypothetical protein QGF63_19780 [Alphaproteobacteria bacterium]|nr:hypothetical protein [Alphaproteobacteria bacterium]
MADDLEPTEPERRLIEAAAKGEVADYAVAEETADDPANGADWGDDRRLRAGIIYALCLGSNDEWPVHAKGVRVRGARIAGRLDFEDAILECSLALADCFIEQEMVLLGAEGRSLNLAGSLVRNIRADRFKTSGGVFLRNGFRAKGEVRLLGADIGGNLDCSNGSFENADGNALFADRLKTAGSVFLSDNFSAKGEVRFLGADIGGSLYCLNGSFKNADGNALSADGLKTAGDVFLRDNFSAKGEVRLLGADIGGDLDCSNGSFENADGKALSADRLKTAGDVFLRDNFSAKGEVRLLGADIGGDLSCVGGHFSNPGSDALSAERAIISGVFFLGEFASPVEGTINLAHAEAGVLADDEAGWPAPGNLVLDGFVYGAIAGKAPTAAAKRLDWLKRQPAGDFRPQPYVQLAKILREMGHERDAREVSIARQEAWIGSGDLGWRGRIWHRFLGLTIGHGYKPWKVLWFFLGIVILGSAVFGLAEYAGLMVPAKERVYLDARYPELPPEYPRFQPHLYSLDVFLPIVDLHQESFWLPKAGTGWGWAVMAYLWLHILLGWVLTTVAVAGLTGLVRRD